MATAPLPKKAVNVLTENVITVLKSAARGSDPFVSLDGRRFSLFRSAANGDDITHVYIGALPGQLKNSDIGAINAMCDQNEGAKNRLVKKDITLALTRYFNDRAFHINEPGCGAFPILNYFPDTRNITFHGIESDPKHVESLHKMGLPASDWEGVPAIGKDRPGIGVSIYALHFMVSRDLPKQIKSLISDDGFFVANFYVDPAERAESKQRDFLERTLKTANMPYIRLRDPACNANEYWVIGKSSDVGPIHDFATILHSSMLLNRKSGPQPAHPAPTA